MNVIATSSLHEIFFGCPAGAEIYVAGFKAFYANSLGPAIRFTNVSAPEPESQPETEQTFTRKERKAYRQTIKPAAKRKAKAWE